MNEEKFNKILKNFSSLKIVEYIIDEDAQGRNDTKWLIIVLKKV